MTVVRNPLLSVSFREFDANGNPLAGGKLYTYTAESTDEQATYPGPQMLLPNTNPVILDADGRASVWLTQGVNYRFDLYDANDVLVRSSDDWPSPITSGNTSGVSDTSGAQPGGRLSLVSNDWAAPSTAGATTIYYVPYKSDKVPLYDGSAWALYSIGSYLSQDNTDNTKSPAAVGNSLNYDLFIWNDSGTVRLSRGPSWSSDIDRGSGAGTTELLQVNGRLANKYSITNGPAAQRGLYVGSAASDASAHFNDTPAIRHVWSNHNRIVRSMQVVEATATWSYKSTWRQANGAAANSLNFLVGVAEDAVSAVVAALAATSSTNTVYVGIGVDSTSTPSGLVGQSTIDQANQLTAFYDGVPGRGRHYLAWLEQGSGAGTVTWSASSLYGGLTGRVLA